MKLLKQRLLPKPDKVGCYELELYEEEVDLTAEQEAYLLEKQAEALKIQQESEVQ